MSALFRLDLLKNGPYEGKGPAYSLTYGDEVVASGGLYLLWPGVCEAWLITTPLIFKYPLAFVREIKKLFKMYDEKGLITRIQSTVKVSDQRAVKFAKSLGFEIEGYMPKYGPDGTDHFLMGRVK